MDSTINRYIITGGPGSGKTALINRLEKRGFICYNEVSRVIIQEQQQSGGNLLPWLNMAGFADECFVRMKRQLQTNHKQPAFYDRGIPDIIAYLRWSNIPVPEQYVNVSHNYYPVVFICLPWEEIYTNDLQRPQTFKESEEIFNHLMIVYKEIGFRIITLAKLSVEQRVEIILERIS